MTEESRRLYEVLDWIGVSEVKRDKFREHATVYEILSTLISNLPQDIPGQVYVFGSYAEGTTTPDMMSDLDVLVCSISIVVEDISHTPQDGQALLMVTDETTHPGYYKLQLVLEKIAQNLTHNIDPSIKAYLGLKPDHYSRLCWQNIQESVYTYGECNGPAITRPGTEGVRDEDLVNALRCQYVPSCANSWLSRVINCDRLNEEQIKILKESGCFFVGINHPSSKNGPIEWRISFSLQERELMASLNSTQHKCYVLLKMIKKDVIHKHAPKSISSYHCKTCVLYAIEETPCVFWRRGNLLECLRFCIRMLLHWVKKNRCPNYFIPDENMFDRLGERSLRQVQGVLEDMLLHWWEFLWSLKCDDIGKVLYAVLYGRGPCIMRDQRETVSKQLQILCLNFTGSLKKCMIKLLMSRISGSADKAVLEFQSIETHLTNTGCVEYHTKEETQLAINYFMPHLRLQIAQCIASIMLATRNADRLSKMFSKFKYYIEESKDCDVISSYLIEASYYIQSERHDICERILLKCETSLKSHVISLCRCNVRIEPHLNEAGKEQLRIFGSHRIKNKQYSRTYTSGCLIFLPHQANLIHPALHYEMYRSFNTPAGSRHKGFDDWFEWIVVDSKVYLYFLQYVLYSKINKPVYKQDAIDNLRQVMTIRENLGHLKTAYNLLGWIFTQKNQIQKALMCFLKSWRIRPINNAAIWHVLSIISSRNS